ncbi:MAG: sigma 54-interacting transcriptional regulator [Desulfocapsaceae bacterium]|jgi:Nif-specific regulatory protein|nr:sigma 54-interacting transcriptional regulator [Desulfocapsaceae bacterium]
MSSAETGKEFKRLARNQRALLEAMPEMVMLINAGKSIEYMNPSAVSFFGDLRHPRTSLDPGRQTVFSALLNLVNSSLANNRSTDILSGAIHDSHLEYCVAPFLGYKGDDLYWLTIRDLTEQKRHQEELAKFHANIESILAYKINRLKESERIRKKLVNQIGTLQEHLENQPPNGTIIGSSKMLKDLRDMVLQVSKSDATILITGESGTGKELVANLIRETSNRINKPFLKINCSSINDSLLESDLFGYEKGSFTGAHKRQIGKFEVVDGGTIFLDEIGNISPRMQAALLRVLQDGEIIRVGGNSPIKVNVRVVAATNTDLAAAVKKDLFRLDLFYRLNIINIAIPPLRERKEDIIDLVTHFVRRYRIAFKKDINFVPKSIIDTLLAHNWPGNVRELENVIQRAVLMAKSNVITDNELIFDIQPQENQALPVSTLLHKYNGSSLKDIVAEFERDLLVHALEKNQGNVATAARSLNVGKTAFYDKMKRYDIVPKDHK